MPLSITFGSVGCRPILILVWVLLSHSATGSLILGQDPDKAGKDTAISKGTGISKDTAISKGTGVIEGTVVYRADKTRPWRFSRYYVKSAKTGLLAEAVVGIHDRKLSLPSSKPQTVTMDQVNFQFTPETITIRTGDSVRFTNSDNEVHSVRTSDAFNSFNITVPKGKEYIQRFPRGASFRPVVLGCAFHGAMRAWIYIFDHPYHALTKSDGQFQLRDVPPGTFTLRMAHAAGKLSWEQEITVVAGKKTELTIEVSPDDHTENNKKRSADKPTPDKPTPDKPTPDKPTPATQTPRK